MSSLFSRVYRPGFVKFALNVWPPFWGAGIKILFISDDFRQVRVRLKLRWWNKNANRSQYGGSIFSLTDPIYALMLMGILGEQYFVWDKQASIDFVQPGRGDLFADFDLSMGQLDDIYRQTHFGDKSFPEFVIHIKDEQGEVVAKVQRKLYVRKKPQYRQMEDNEV
ncbi:hypothetical protein VII00023_20772 [Vibrio ichthyoenteri ATCC 700023]|uniref:Translation elongation factor P (EF-P) n=1 Tax=Vibrio ichthyoenteri ATCC 700023 TaxID=870968 RepID=F9RX64_9VIBR|nr:DUF4442 domain-containing protein [Vibrio ichthyoenteri]EGU48187.1 hypothetical protein VII00023_20772 [Vibrio ichthyoenteri ATCC 700023]